MVRGSLMKSPWINTKLKSALLLVLIGKIPMVASGHLQQTV